MTHHDAVTLTSQGHKHYTVKVVYVVEILIAFHTALSPSMAQKLLGT